MAERLFDRPPGGSRPSSRSRPTLARLLDDRAEEARRGGEVEGDVAGVLQPIGQPLVGGGIVELALEIGDALAAHRPGSLRVAVATRSRCSASWSCIPSSGPRLTTRMSRSSPIRPSRVRLTSAGRQQAAREVSRAAEDHQRGRRRRITRGDLGRPCHYCGISTWPPKPTAHRREQLVAEGVVDRDCGSARTARRRARRPAPPPPSPRRSSTGLRPSPRPCR